MNEITKISFAQRGSSLVNINAIKDVNEYLCHIDYIQDKWKLDGMWFRGVTKQNYKLIPSIYRDEIWNYKPSEAYDSFNHFIRIAKGLNREYSNLYKWDWYQLQQHYGFPTRLLDWTEGSLIGLYFSVRKLASDTSPTVWIVDPFKLNEIAIEKRVLLYSDQFIQDEEDEILKKYIPSKNELPPFPVGILPTYFDNRISSQKSAFTIHGSIIDGFDQVFFKDKINFKCFKLMIDPSKAERIKTQLVEIGISEFTLFPDLEGLAREIKDSYGMKKFY